MAPELRLPELPEHITRPPRGAPADDRAWRRRVVWLVLLGHVLGLVLVDRAMRARLPQAPEQRDAGVEIRFLQAPSPDTAGLRVDTALSELAPTRRRMPPAERSLDVQFLAPSSPPPATTIDARRLFRPDGSLDLSEAVIAASRPPTAPSRQGAPATAQPDAPLLPPERTRFDRAWVPDGENLAQEATRKIPPLGLLLGASQVPDCPPQSDHPDCEAMERAQRAQIPLTPQSGKQPW
jgi:hypothetical protein